MMRANSTSDALANFVSNDASKEKKIVRFKSHIKSIIEHSLDERIKEISNDTRFDIDKNPYEIVESILKQTS